MADSVARLVYQLLSTLWSLERNHISSASVASSAKEAETYLGCAMIASAYLVLAWWLRGDRCSSDYLLPAMYNGLVRSQPRQSQCPHFCAYAHSLSSFALIWELDIVLQCQSLSDEVVIDQVEDPARK
jgi:uncharacterized membrane protein